MASLALPLQTAPGLFSAKALHSAIGKTATSANCRGHMKEDLCWHLERDHEECDDTRRCQEWLKGYRAGGADGLSNRRSWAVNLLWFALGVFACFIVLDLINWLANL